jgi:hypothetical protein
VSVLEGKAVMPRTGEPIRACQLGDLRWSTLPFGDANQALVFASTAMKTTALARHSKEAAPTRGT